MNIFAERLHRCGFPMHVAYRTVCDFMKNFGLGALREFVEDMERQCYVEAVQP